MQDIVNQKESEATGEEVDLDSLIAQTVIILESCQAALQARRVRYKMSDRTFKKISLCKSSSIVVFQLATCPILGAYIMAPRATHQ